MRAVQSAFVFVLLSQVCWPGGAQADTSAEDIFSKQNETALVMKVEAAIAAA